MFLATRMAQRSALSQSLKTATFNRSGLLATTQAFHFSEETAAAEKPAEEAKAPVTEEPSAAEV